MLTEILAAAATPPKNAFGFIEAMEQGGVIAWSVLAILTIMSVSSFYILFSKLFEQNKIMKQGAAMRSNFWRAGTLKEGAAKLDKNSAYRQIVDDAIKADADHAKLTDPVEAHDWLHGSVARSDQVETRNRPAMVGNRWRNIAIHRTVRYGYRHLSRSDQNRHRRPGIDRRRCRPGW